LALMPRASDLVRHLWPSGTIDQTSHWVATPPCIGCKPGLLKLWANAGVLAGHYEALAAFVVLRAVDNQGTYRSGHPADEAAAVTARCVELVRMALVDLIPSQ
jgi:hypothetical protein